ncbi:hypothetical protein SOJ46_33175 [Pseudomonas aeruginosa]|uniref:hypothetical protein n=1 Tax=Pseudomonas aeruginosa TaxID=287 RepID=UPI00249817D8|nr:hypothetical protein [Pseudomonas aeruginosa]MCT5439700.1 hypothetical protein [Pseudomonas aeruginosa]MDI2409526.1 hypothetical protein [Pseudomonas aeruginosa]MDY1536437.1 hypothetical protein [Pseudomonas aeruginosa]HEJ3087516.1 hypothetical protein [Pseudomonas aeruginosa]
MNKANECTCPSGDGSLVHPCPAHPAVEQVGGDERKLSDLGNELHNLSCSIVHENEEWAEQIGGIARELWNWPQARAALAQPSPKCATCNGSKVVSTTDTDHNGDYIEAPCPKCGGTGEADSGGVHPWGEPVLIPCDCETEKAEAERPVVVARLYRSNDLTMTPFAEVQKPLPLPASDGTLTVDALMTVAQHERIVEARWNRAMDLMGEHVARISEKLKAERDAALAEVERLRQFERICEGLPQDAIDGGWTVQGIRAHSKQLEEQLKVALARVAELEKQDPVATIAKVPGEDWNGLHFYRDLQGMQPGTKLYAAPVAQAQQLHDLDKQCRDDVARALGLRPSQERGFAWSYLLASIKSCVKASEDAAQAQHSVPGKYDDVLLPFLKSMEHELHANAGKGDRPGWLQMDRRTALLEIYYHLAKLQKATKDNDAAGIVEYAADVANMSMMLVDVCGLLAAAPGKEEV